VVTTDEPPPTTTNGAHVQVVLWTAGLIAAAFLIVMVHVALTAFGEAQTVGIAAASVVTITGLTFVAARYPRVPWRVTAAVALTVCFAALSLAALGLQWHSQSELGLYRLLRPTAWIAGLASLVVLGAAAVVAPRRSATPTWLLAIGTFALVGFIALALWLPLYGAMQPELPAVVPPALLTSHLAPLLLLPAGFALTAAFLVVYQPRRVADLGVNVAFLLVPLTAFAAIARAGGAMHSLYTEFAPVVIGAGWFALASVLALAVSHLRRAHALESLRTSGRAFHGSVVIEPPASTTVHALDNLGWLAGYRAIGAPFVLRLGHDDIALPASVEVNAPLPPWLADCPTGGRVPLLSNGDEIDVVGLDVSAADGPYRAADGPYRAAARPMLGTRGVVVFAPRRHDEPWGRDVVQRLWQPCVALLLAAIVAATPALVGLV